MGEHIEKQSTKSVLKGGGMRLGACRDSGLGLPSTRENFLASTLAAGFMWVDLLTSSKPPWSMVEPAPADWAAT